MKTKTKRKISTTPIVLAVALVLVISMTLASLYYKVSDVSRLFSVSNFRSGAVVYFDANSNGDCDSGEAATSDSNYGATGKYYTVSLNSSDSNYIGKLRVDVTYAGYGVGLIRARVIEEWSSTTGTTRTVLPYKIKMPYTVDLTDHGNASKWFDNRTKDYTYYYATPVRATSDNTAKTLHLITGFDPDDETNYASSDSRYGANAVDFGAVDSGTVMHLLVETDVVQVNRYPQYWQMQSLPWTGDATLSPSSLTEVQLS